MKQEVTMAKTSAPDVAVSDDRFGACIPHTLAQEAPDTEDWSNHKNFSNDVHDPGGATMCGIIQSEYNAWRTSHGLPVQSVELLSEAEGYAIYRQKYWQPHCATLPAGLDLCYFDSAVNQGTGEATKILQVALGLHSDGVWGPATAAAVAALTDNDSVQSAIKAFTARRLAVYKMTRGFQYFGKDWTRRANDIMAEALQQS
jgi:lysozyme family protein